MAELPDGPSDQRVGFARPVDARGRLVAHGVRMHPPPPGRQSPIRRQTVDTAARIGHRTWGMRVLFASHTARMSGAEWWLLDTLRALPPRVEPWVATPPGRFEELVRRLGVQTVPIAGTDGSLKLHPVHTTRAVLELATAGWQLHLVARRLQADIVHANSIRIALSAVAAQRLGAPPTVAHVHECLPPGPVSNAALRFIAGAEGVLVNSIHTRELFQRVVPGSNPEVLYNGVNLERFDPARHDRDEARGALGVRPDDLALAVVAQITPWKGQEEAIRITAALRDRGLPVLLLLVGTAVFVTRSTRYDNRSYEAKLHSLVSDFGLGDAVRFLGQQDDIPRVLRSLDLLLVPSWEEPFGRTVVEAMAMGVPVAGTNVGGPRELILDRHTGLLLPPRQPEVWADALEPVLRDRARTAAMGDAALRRAQRDFGLDRITGQLVDFYDRLLATPA